MYDIYMLMVMRVGRPQNGSSSSVFGSLLVTDVICGICLFFLLDIKIENR